MTKVVNLNGRGSDKDTDLLKKVPKAPTYLCDVAKRHFEKTAGILITAKLLKTRHLEALAILADNIAQKEFAIREIRRKNKLSRGEGYIQTFKSGATNITTEMVLRTAAEKRILETLSLFGMDPKSEKAISPKDNGQLGFDFEDFKKSLTS